MDELHETQTDCDDEDPRSKLINELQQKIRVQASIIQKLQSQINDTKSTRFLPQFHSNKDETVAYVEDKSFKGRVQNDYPILYDLFTKTANQSKDFNKETFQLSNDIMFFSPKAHQLLVNKMNFPSKYLLNQKFNNEFSELLASFSDLSKTKDIIQMYKRKNKIHDSINVALSVDAVYFHPVITISDKLDISGMEIPSKENKLTRDIFDLFQNQPVLFEAFIEKNCKFILRSAFLYQIQPLRSCYPNFVIFLKETYNGSANNETIDLLFKLKGLCKDLNVNVRTFSFDGDPGYKTLQKRFYDSYIVSLIQNSINFSKHLNCQRISPDPLHLYKRLRYRLLSHIIHGGFSNENPYIDMSKIKEILSHLPSVVFNNQPISKMHDKLPVLLFSSKSLIELYNKGEYVAFAYCFPITCSMIAFDDDSLSNECRTFLFECALWFIVKYTILRDQASSQNKDMLNEKKHDDNLHVQFYDNDLLIEFSNMLFCAINLIEIIPDIYLERITTVPLEHKFGTVKIRCEDIETLRRFELTLAKLQSYQFCNIDDVHGRMKSFGAITNNSHSDFFDDDCTLHIEDCTPQSIVDDVLRLSSFVNDEEKMFDALSWFLQLLEFFVPNENNTSHQITSYKIEAGVHQGLRAKQMIKGQYEFTHYSLSHYKIFINYFVSKFNRKPHKKDLIKILKAIKSKFGDDVTIPTVKDKMHLYKEWFEANYDHFKDFIGTLEFD